MSYCVIKLNFTCAFFVSEVFAAIRAMPILLVSCFGYGCSLCRNFFKIMVCAVNLAVLFAAVFADCLAYAGSLAA